MRYTISKAFSLIWAGSLPSILARKSFVRQQMTFSEVAHTDSKGDNLGRDWIFA